jgi:transcriptional regulator with XRE-family HTH domain
LSQIENEIKWPTQKTIDKICQALEIPEILLYIVALQEEEVPASKRQKYHIIFPSIINLTLQLVSTEHASLVNNINVVEKERQIFKNLREPA